MVGEEVRDNPTKTWENSSALLDLRIIYCFQFSRDWENNFSMGEGSLPGYFLT